MRRVHLFLYIGKISRALSGCECGRFVIIHWKRGLHFYTHTHTHTPSVPVPLRSDSVDRLVVMHINLKGCWASLGMFTLTHSTDRHTHARTHTHSYDVKPPSPRKITQDWNWRHVRVNVEMCCAPSVCLQGSVREIWRERWTETESPSESEVKRESDQRKSDSDSLNPMRRSGESSADGQRGPVGSSLSWTSCPF